jgi:hypothetical protein
LWFARHRDGDDRSSAYQGTAHSLKETRRATIYHYNAKRTSNVESPEHKQDRNVHNTRLYLGARLHVNEHDHEAIANRFRPIPRFGSRVVDQAVRSDHLSSP